jgi:hypothetical protein
MSWPTILTWSPGSQVAGRDRARYASLILSAQRCRAQMVADLNGANDNLGFRASPQPRSVNPDHPFQRKRRRRRAPFTRTKKNG